jgi:Tetraspanin family.
MLYTVCFLFQYFIIVFLIFVIMLVGGILGYVFREKVHTTMEQEMQSSLRLYYTNRGIQRAWDDTQEKVYRQFIYFINSLHYKLTEITKRKPLYKYKPQYIPY